MERVYAQQQLQSIARRWPQSSRGGPEHDGVESDDDESFDGEGLRSEQQ
jgi:hypothetical protein